MSLSTPPPCRSPRQNHGMCGPECSSAARARYGRAGEGRAARPEQLAARAPPGARSTGSRGNPCLTSAASTSAMTTARLGDVPRQRLLAGHAAQLALAAHDGVGDLLEVLDAGMIGTRRSRWRRSTCRPPCRRWTVGLAGADVERAGDGRGPRRSPGWDSRRRGCRHPEHPSGTPVEAGVEPAPDDADAQTRFGHVSRRSGRASRAARTDSPASRRTCCLCTGCRRRPSGWTRSRRR